MRTLMTAAVAALAAVTGYGYTVNGAGGAGAKLEDKPVQSFKVHFAPRACAAPKLDGKLDDPCWKGVEPITDYGPCTIFGPDKKRLPRTEIYLTWDDKYFYVGAKCYEDCPENMESFKKNVTDGKRSYIVRDCIELHIDGNNDEHTTFQCWMLATPEKHIQWNYDFGWGLLVDENYGLNANWDTANFVGEDYWCVEARYAHAHFELKPQVGYIFGLEPARFRFDKKIFAPDGTVKSKSSGMFLGWGSQGGSHHEPNRYGKIIFVDKKPASVPEGLKLAYPDLDQRRIMVQSGTAYAVFDCGKTSTLTYEEKAKDLVATTQKNADRYRAFYAEVSNLVFRACGWQIGQTANKLKEFETMRANVAARTSFDIGFLNDLEKKCHGWDEAFDKAYWEMVRDAMKVEGKTRRPVTLNPPANAPALGSEFSDWTLRPNERTHDVVAWAKPIAGGAKKVFITVNSQGEMDAWQLAKRMDMKATIFTATGQEGAIGVSGDYFNEGHWYTPKKRQELERALKERGPFDAFVFIGTRISTWPAELQCWLFERMLEGAQVLEQNGGYAAFSKLTENKEIMRGSPKGLQKLVGNGGFNWKLVPVNIGNEPLKSCTFGKGGYGRMSGEYQSEWCYSVRGSPAWPGNPEHVFQDEYGFAYLVRNVMEMLGYRKGRRAVDVGDGLAEVEAGKDATVGFRTAGAKRWGGEVRWTVRDLFGKVLQEGRRGVTLAAGTNHYSIALKPLEAGEYYLDAKLLEGGRVRDFATGRVVAKHTERFVKCGCSPTCRELVKTPEIAEFTLGAKTLWSKDEPVRATVKVAPVAAGLRVRAEIRDVRNRVIVRQDYPVDAASGVVKIALKNVPEYDWTAANLDVSLLSGARKLGAKSAQFFRHRGSIDDYMIFTGAVAPGGWNGKMRMAYLQNSGAELAQADYSPQFLAYGFEAVTRDRIPGGEPDKGGALSNPWWLKHLRERYGKHAKNLREVNGRFVSLGDDSGEPHDFPRQVPDWVPCWVDRQMKALYAKSDWWKRQGHKRPMLQASGDWWKAHGVNRGGCDDIRWWSFEIPIRGMAVGFLSKDMTDAQLKEFVDCFKEVYGTLEKFNRASGLKVADWKAITRDVLKTAKWDPSPEFVNFLFWLKARYKTIDKLNAVWKTSEKDFPSIPRSRIDEQLGKGVYAPSIDMQTFLEDAFVGQAKAIAEGIHGQDATIGLGFGASTLGNTFCAVTKYLDSVCPYAGSFDIELLRAQKHRYIGECIGIYGGRNVPTPLRRKQVWHGLLTGCNFGWFWDSCFNNSDNSIDARVFGAMFETYREVKRGPAALCLRSKRDNYGIRLFCSRDAGHIAPILKDISTPGHSMGCLAGVVCSLGFQFDSITAEQVSKGALQSEGVKVLLLPCAQILRQSEIDAIRAFVKRGGTLIGDVREGLFDEHGAPWAKPALDDIFGVTTGPVAKPVLCDLKVGASPLPGALVDASVKPTTAQVLGRAENGAVAFLVNTNGCGKGRAVLFNFNLAVIPFLDGRGELGGVRDTLEGLFAQAGLKAPAVLKGADGKVITGTEFTRYTRGDEIYLGVEKTGHAYEKFPMKGYVALDKKYWVYDVRAGKKVGFTDCIPMNLEGLDIGLYSLLPAEVQKIVLDVPATVKPGESLKASAKLVVRTTSPQQQAVVGTRVFRWELIPQGGYTMEEFIPYPWRVRDAAKGEAATAWAIGYGEKPGTRYTAVVTDVETGVSASRVVTVAERYFDGAELAPGNFHAKELCRVKNVKSAGGQPIVLVKGEAKLPIVYAQGGNEEWAAKQIANVIFEMTGCRPQLICERIGKPVTNTPALFVGKTTASIIAGLEAPKDHLEAFRVVAKNGSIYFLGKSSYAATDWLERQLGARHYWPMRPCDLYNTRGTNYVWGLTVVKTDGLAVKPLDWNDRPRYEYRESWPYGGTTWDRWAKGGNSHRGGVSVHAPHGWWKEKDALEHVEIFALSEDGKRPTSPLLCYGNPKTLAYYEMRTKQGIEAWKAFEANPDPKKGRFKDPAGGILNYRQRVVTISQWDCGVNCACEYCKKLFDEKSAGGSGSPIIWGFFTREYAKWLKAEYPDWKIAILPYINTCEIPPDPEDPKKPLDLAKYGNVEAMLCTMPGVAMMKNDACKKYEEDLIRRWVKCTGNPVLNWHYSCWPAEFTAAPYIYGKTAQKHYLTMGKDVCGSFLNGPFDAVRFSLSVYVWMKCLWNPDFDVEALYDDFASRMFGKAAKPMRKLIQMQEDGWNRQWGSNMCSVKNVYKVSYPRAEVKEMEQLFVEAERLAKGDEKATARIAWYKQGFVKFFKESEENESGKAFAPMMMKKAVSQPKVDGKLDDACWKIAEPRNLVAALCKTNAKPAYATEVRVVWYPGETGGLTFGFKCEEPATKIMKQGVSGDTWGQDNIEIFLDASGTGEGHFYHPIIDATGRVTMYTSVDGWLPKNTKTGVYIGDGWWSMEVFIPFSDLKGFPKVQLPTTSANGIVWTGNFNRWRVGDCSLPKDKRMPGSKHDWSRLNTRYNFWNKDPAAFGPFVFVE